MTTESDEAGGQQVPDGAVQINPMSMVEALQEQLAEAYQQLHNKSTEVAMYRARAKQVEKEIAELRSTVDELAKGAKVQHNGRTTESSKKRSPRAR